MARAPMIPYQSVDSSPLPLVNVYGIWHCVVLPSLSPACSRPIRCPRCSIMPHRFLPSRVPLPVWRQAPTHSVPASRFSRSIVSARKDTSEYALSIYIFRPVDFICSSHFGYSLVLTFRFFLDDELVNRVILGLMYLE